MTVKLDSKLPEGDGLQVIQSEILRHPKRPVVVVAVVHVATVETNVSSGVQHPKLVIDAIEAVVSGGESQVVMDIMQLTAQARTGQGEIRHFEDSSIRMRTGLFEGEPVPDQTRYWPTDKEADEKMPRSGAGDVRD